VLAVVATVEVKAGKEKEFEGIMRGLAAKVRTDEPGCKLYVLHRAKAARTYVVLERYNDQAAFQTHTQSAHFKAAAPKMMECLASPLKVEMLEEVV